MVRRVSTGMALALLAGCTYVFDRPGDPAPSVDGNHRTEASPPSWAEPAVAVVAGARHACALSLSGAVSCWGYNADGRLGYGHTRAIGDDELAGADGRVSLGEKVRALVAGARHNCALMSGGAIRCWGFGGDLALGRGHAHDENIGDDELPGSVPPAIIYGGPVRRLAAGASHGCRLTESGLVKCWGTSLDGALGYGTTTQSGGWLGEVPLGAKAVDLVAGYDHTCALLDGGQVRCWGNATALGLGGQENIGDDEPPSAVGTVPVEPMVQLAAGGRHTCALSAAGTVRCWGAGAHGVLGYAASADVLRAQAAGPVEVGATVVQLAAGNEHTCALTAEGGVRCWGAGAQGALGHGSTADVGDDEPPAAWGDVALAEKAVQVAAGDGFSCALLESGRVSCWGNGKDGQLGYGGTSNIGDDELPRSIPPLEPFAQ